MINYIDHMCTDEAVCPSCGKSNTDSWELGGDGCNSGEIECECGATYTWERQITIDYSTYLKEVEDA